MPARIQWFWRSPPKIEKNRCRSPKHYSGVVFATIFEGDALIAAGIPAWHSHWHFVTSLQRGGTCAAHPPPPEGMPCVPDSKHWNLLYCLPLRPAFRIRLQIPSSKAFPHPFVPSPGPARTAALRPQFALEASKCDFSAFQKSSYFLLPFCFEKIAKIMVFGLPKRSQNPAKIHSKSMSPKTCDFSWIFADFWLLVAKAEPQISCAQL